MAPGKDGTPRARGGCTPNLRWTARRRSSMVGRPGAAAGGIGHGPGRGDSAVSLTRTGLACGLAAAALSGGCAIFRGEPPPSPPPGGRLVEVGAPDQALPSPQTAAKATPRPPRHVLAISGGGMYGAYSAGVLRGWTEAGTRPTFDVVTGVSTGALIAPFAFLGAEFDDLLEREYTRSVQGDIYRKRVLLAPLWSDSIADSTPLRRRIAADITPALLDRIARAHEQGRRLYVGTTNLDTKQLVVWDLGAIAAGDGPNRLALIRHVILASCSVPGFFAPVPIDVEVDGRRYTELHADGGVAASLFLRPEMVGLDPLRPRRPTGPDRTEIRVIVSGKLDAPGGPVTRSFLGVSTDALSGVLKAQQDGDLMQVFLLSRYLGADFSLTAVPRDLPVNGSAFDFDPGPMRLLYAAGRRAAADPSAWRSLPPGLTPDELARPRAGTQFTVEAGGHAPVAPAPPPAADVLRASGGDQIAPRQ